MKYLASFIFFCFVLSNKAQVPDASHISVRFNNNIDKIDIGHHLYEYINNKLYSEKLILNDTIRNKVKGSNYKYSLEQIGLNYCYLFDEKEYWSQRVIRTIDLSILNNDFFSNADDKYNFVRLIYQGAKKDKITLYENGLFKLYTQLKPKVLTNSKVSYLAIKEDYLYNENSGRLEAYPVGIQFLDENKNNIAWTYWQEVRYYLENENYDTWSHMAQLNLIEVIEKHKYKTSHIKTFNAINTQSGFRGKDTYNEHRNDYLALFKIYRMEEHIQRNSQDFTGNFIDTLADGKIIKGQFKNGVKTGRWNLLFNNGNTELSVYYNNNRLERKCKLYNEDGNLIIEGEFKNNLRTGLWKFNFNNGERMALRTYKQGSLDGEQFVWFQNGQPHLIYNYSNNKLNGSFKRWNSDGILTEQGTFKDNLFSGEWQIMLQVPTVYQEIIWLNPDLDWQFKLSALDDGYLKYGVNPNGLEYFNNERNFFTTEIHPFSKYFQQ